MGGGGKTRAAPEGDEIYDGVPLGGQQEDPEAGAVGEAVAGQEVQR